jgi:hypothetical protein
MNALQSAKDSFYVALRTRLAATNPQRTIDLSGQDVPAILVEENEPATASVGLCPVPPIADCFYLRYGTVRALDPSSNALAPFALDCTIAYRTRGTRDDAIDRGRTLSALDAELLAIAYPPRTGHCDYEQRPPVDLGLPVFWTAPQLAAIESVGAELRRSVQLTIFFYAEESANA